MVINNLQIAFPNKTQKEKVEIYNTFKHHFANLIFELIKLITISKKNLDKRYHFKNTELLKQLYLENKHVLLITGHYANWEWSINLSSKIEQETYAIYQKIKDPLFDNWLKKLRSSYGTELIEMRNAYRTIIKAKQKDKPSLTYLLADQSPPKEHPYRTDFYGLEVPFYNGPEVMATKLKMAVVYLDVKRIKKGHYEAEFKLISEDGSKESPNFITNQYKQFLYSEINHDPGLYLWSHRRWKHAKK